MSVEPVGEAVDQLVAPRRRQGLPEEVASYVRELVISGTVRPGDFLRLDRIAAEVGISITPVREGLLELRAQGYVRLLPRRGFVVEPFTAQDIHDLFWAQGFLAGELAARAAKNITAAQLDRLDNVVDTYDAAIAAGDNNRIIDLGHAYHREINLAAQSTRLAKLLDSVVKTLPPRFYATIHGWVDETRHEHPEIVDALRAADSKKARRLMERHISFGGDRLIETLEARGFWNTQPF
jgi:DNA-binding GntR family transcriptional regulator